MTLTTVGYGDRSPVTLAGRLIAGIWMLFAMIGGASLTASIATALTVNRLDQATLDTADKLKRHRVAVIPGTTGDFLAQRHGAILVQASSVEDGMAKLLAGEAEALVWDKPALQYLLREHQGPQKLVLSEATYDPHGYGFVLPHQSPLEHRLNIALLELEEAGITRGISTRMLGE